MGLGGKMDDRVGLGLREDVAHARAVGDVGADEAVAPIVGDRGKGIEIAGIGQLVDHHRLVRSRADDVAHQRGADEARPSGDQETHCKSSSAAFPGCGRSGIASTTKPAARSRRYADCG